MYSFSVEGFRPPLPYSFTIARMKYERIRQMPSGLFSVRHLGFTMVEAASPVIPGENLPPDFVVVGSEDDDTLRQIYETEQTEVDSLDELVSRASATWKALLTKSKVIGVSMHASEVRTPIEDPNSLVVVADFKEARTFMNGGEGPTEFSHFIANGDEQDAMQRITQTISLASADAPDNTPGHGPHM